MKVVLTIAFLIPFFASTCAYAQKASTREKYGNTLNIGIGVGGYAGYYGYYRRSIPIIGLNYEFQVEKNFTLAPSLGFYSYNDDYYWHDKPHGYPDKYYRYHETAILPGVKATYYFDDLLKAGPKWDFYLAASLGFAFVNSYWDGNRSYNSHSSQMFLDIHIGTEYHINNRCGIFFDLSTRTSMIGVAIH